jgi:AraC-like DNA-binding protein
MVYPPNYIYVSQSITHAINMLYFNSEVDGWIAYYVSVSIIFLKIRPQMNIKNEVKPQKAPRGQILPVNVTQENILRLQNLKPYVRQTRDHWREPWFIEERRLLDYLIVYIRDGTGFFSVEKDAFEVKKGDLIWIPPDTLHEMRGTTRMHCVYAHFDLLYNPKRSHWDMHIPGGRKDLSEWNHLMHPPLPDPQIAAWRGKISVPNHAAIGALLQKIALEHARSPSDSAIMLSGLMIQVVAEIIRGMFKGTNLNAANWRAMQTSFDEISNRMEKPVSVSLLAKSTFLSESHFRKVFKEVHGQPPRTIHRQIRIQKGREMLNNTRLSVSEIAYKLGFSTVHNFSRAFKALMGVSPKTYRKGQM